MSATVEVITAEKNGVLVVPIAAIITENGHSYIERALDPETLKSLFGTGRNGSGKLF